jgi:uncharacterized protein with PIN domain
MRPLCSQSGHRAQLNFVDCLAYAIAKVADLPLLYKGDDFVHTDIAAAHRSWTAGGVSSSRARASPG